MIISCRKCGKRTSDRAPECGFCGAKLLARTVKRPRASQPPTKPGEVDEAFLAEVRSLASGEQAALPVNPEQAKLEAVALFDRAGLDLQMTPACLERLDIFINDKISTSGLSPDTEEWFPSTAQMRLVSVIGSYVGDTLRKRYGGIWRPGATSPKDPLFQEIIFPQGGITWPIGKVFKRFKNGVAESISPYFSALGRHLGVSISQPGDAVSWTRQGRLLLDAGQFKHGIKFIERSIAIQPNAGEHWYEYGRVLAALGQREEAMGALRKSLLLDLPDVVMAQNAQERLAQLEAGS